MRQEHSMSEISERYRTVAGQFTEQAKAVPTGAWDNPTWDLSRPGREETLDADEVARRRDAIMERGRKQQD
jgi:hypothetical protein